ncbi:MAG: hypothetical protein ACLUE8_04965 [Lachnospiraceae bacterium]
MKYETTKKAILSNYSNIIKVGYCSLQTLLKFHSPSAYTASKTYGWRADIYEITPSTVIVTGYAPFGNIVPDYETIKKYEEKAQEESALAWNRRESSSQAYSNDLNAMDALLHEFVREVTPN